MSRREIERHSGAICYYNDQGRFHREDGPAVEWPAGTQYEGTKSWWFNGKRHRIDGPAIVSHDGQKEWWVNGKRHRINGPAIIYAGHTSLWLDGKPYPEPGFKSWWLNGQNYSEQEYWSILKQMEQHKCVCDIATIMSCGCQCGGK